MSPVKILMVEDDTEVLGRNGTYLKSQGYQVYPAANLACARALLWEYIPDLVLLDVILPDGSGYDFCREMRRTSSAPILFLSHLNDDFHIVKGFRYGGDDFIVKPCSLEVLSAHVQALLRRAGRPMTNRIELPPLCVDLQKDQATLYGEEIFLSRKELLLLAFFCANAGREFSSETLYRAVWGEEPLGRLDTVKTHVCRLRRKLHLDDGSPFELRKSRNRGYMFLKVIFESESHTEGKSPKLEPSAPHKR